MSDTNQLEALQAELSKLQDALAASQNDTRIQVEARQADIDRIEELCEENDKLKGENESLKIEIERLVNLPGNEEKSEDSPSVFEYEGRKYRVLCKACRIPGLGRRTALEILADTDAQSKLVSMNAGVIQEIE
jgi:SMC interacting uncharacterized protein involved in chromosome segregation